MKYAAVTLLVLAGCFDPTPPEGAACSESNLCPPEQICRAGTCQSTNADAPDADPDEPDADPNMPDADPDAPDADPNAPDADVGPPDATPGDDGNGIPDGSGLMDAFPVMDGMV